MFTTILFDFDGTIADTNQLVFDSWQHLYQARLGRDGDPEMIQATYGEPLVTSIAKAFPDFDVAESVAIYRSYQADKYEPEIQPFPGMVDLIQRLWEQGNSAGVVTSRTGEATWTGLKKFGLADSVACLISCDDTTKHKPDPEPILMALDRMGRTTAGAVYIGDSLYDIRCAHNAGMAAILVGWTVAVEPDALTGEDRPEYLAQTAEELARILGL